MGVLVGFVILLAVVIVCSVWARRRHIRNRLIRNGARAMGGQTRVSTAPAGASPLRKAVQTISVVSYVDGEGTRRSITPRQLKLDWGDASGAVTVIYDAKRPDVEDRILFGFGREPARWYRARFHGTR